MQSSTFIVLAALVALALAEGQFYVPRSYYIIDAEGHESAPVPLRRLRRSLQPYPLISRGYGGASASANANANAWGGADAHANANANANANEGWGGWSAPSGGYGSSNPALSAGQSRHQTGFIEGGRSVVASSSVGLGPSGKGYYDQHTSVTN